MEIPKKIYFKLRPLILPIKTIIKFIPKNASILDLGCGKGILSNHIRDFESYTGVDLNIELNDPKEKITFIKDNCINFINKDLSSFNTFILIDLLHHLNEKEQILLLSKLIESTKSEDLIIIKDINPRNIIFSFWNNMHDLLISKQKPNYFKFSLFERKLNLEIIKIAGFHERIFLYDHYFFILKKKVNSKRMLQKI